MIQGNALAIPLADNSVHCVVTSPPYFGLRDYGVTGQLGLEPTPEAYIANMVAVFREVRRVLRADGVCWLNLGDSYGGAAGNNRGEGAGGGKHKDLLMIPARVALALQSDGWYLRQDIIWHKPNPMPESVRDRCTKAHEYVFLLTKSARYFYDAEAVSEKSVDAESYTGKRKRNNNKGIRENEVGFFRTRGGLLKLCGNVYPTRNRRSVWTITTRPYKGAHFATMPPKLVEPCILAGTSERGVCPQCGAQWVRVMERQGSKSKASGKTLEKRAQGLATAFNGYEDGSTAPVFITLGFRPACDCEAGEPIPATVFDPFGGSGTTGAVAKHLGRRFVMLELNAAYIELQKERIKKVVTKLL